MDRWDLELHERQEVAAVLQDGAGFVINRTDAFAWRDGTATVHAPGCSHAWGKSYPPASVDDLIEAVVGEASDRDQAKLCLMCDAKSAVLALPHLDGLYRRIFEPLNEARMQRVRRALDELDW